MTRLSNRSIRRLTDRDFAILYHVARYRLTTIEALCRTVLPGLSANAAGKIVNRLCAAGYLQKFEMVHPGKYYVLGDQGVRLLGAGGHRTASLGPQSLPTEYAVLAYATLGKHQRRRLTSDEVALKCPGLKRSLADSPHCEDPTRGVLELVRVDLGGPVDHVVRKCHRDLVRRYRFPHFAKLVTQGEFRLVVITTTSAKAAAIGQSLDHRDWPGGLMIHFSVIPQLLTIMTRHFHA